MSSFSTLSPIAAIAMYGAHECKGNKPVVTPPSDAQLSSRRIPDAAADSLPMEVRHQCNKQIKCLVL
jgi:hypothetical protein